MSVTRFGLIGHPVAHSLSPAIHAALLQAAGRSGTYDLIDLEPDHLAVRLTGLLQRYDGLNCTIPHKQAVIPFLDCLDESARRNHAVNTICGRTGHNTDESAFADDCPPLAGLSVLILGAGGVSRTMAVSALHQQAAVVRLLARRSEQARQLADELRSEHPDADIAAITQIGDLDPLLTVDLNHTGSTWVLLNGTPAGLWPHTDGLPFPADRLAGFRFIYDTVYNPVATRLVLAAREQKIPAYGGLGMLFGQAVSSQRIWQPGISWPRQTLSQIRQGLAREILRRFPVQILLTGFMGSGKTTTGRLVAARLKLPFVDLDEQIASKEGRSIPDIFASVGEAGFRRIEHSCLESCLASGTSQVLATGGGALLESAAQTLLRQFPCQVIWLDASLPATEQRIGHGTGRPLIERQKPEAWRDLYVKRRPLYQKLAWLRVNADEPAESVSRQIIETLGFN